MALDLGIFLEGSQSTFKVKVSENDAQAQFLLDKLTSSDGSVTITETNDGSVEQINLTASGGGGGISSPLTTKGDLFTYDTDNQRLGIGTDGQALIADSSEPTGLKWDTVGVAVGRFGISNSDGEYTYYDTLQLAINAASSGQTVEVFADYTESTDTAVTLKDGVTINGNGHSYTMNFASSTHALTADTLNGTYRISNFNVYRENSAAGSVLLINNNGITVDAAGSYFEGDSTGTLIGVIGTVKNTVQLLNARVHATGNSPAIRFYNNAAEVHNSYATTSSGNTSYALVALGRLTHSVGIGASGGGILANSAYHCKAVGVGTALFLGANANALHCVGVSTAGLGINANQASLYNCYGQGTTNGILGGVQVINCVAKSSTDYAIENTILNSKILHTYMVSTSAPTLYISSGRTNRIQQNTIISEWNDANGNGVDYSAVGGTTAAQTVDDVITNNVIKVANSSALAIDFVGAFAQPVRDIKLASNTYEGMTTALATDVNQTIVNTQDSQGNILI
jgi:hypothetical protein